MKTKTWAASILLASTTGPAHARGPFDLPESKTLVRAEDRERVRLFRAPCAQSDAGRGCYNHDGRLSRKYPCASYDDTNTVTSLPTDQCYVMESPRRYRGVWLNIFEGQQFIPAGTAPIAVPTGDPRSAADRALAERARAQRIWLNSDRLGLIGRAGNAHRLSIEFVGRRTKYPGAFGHFGMSGHEMIVDRLIAMTPIE